MKGILSSKNVVAKVDLSGLTSNNCNIQTEKLYKKSFVFYE